jgi:hypothetical protein
VRAVPTMIDVDPLGEVTGIGAYREVAAIASPVVAALRARRGK